MSMNAQALSTKIALLPQAVQQEIADYIEFLVQKYRPAPVPSARHFRFNWEGGLTETYGHLTSVELQHQALEWR